MALTIVLVLALTACGIGDLIDVGRQVQRAIDEANETETHSDVQTEDSDKQSSAPTGDSDTRTDARSDDGDTPMIGKYRYMPIEALLVREPGENEFTGSYFFVHILNPDTYTVIADGTVSHVDAFVNLEGNDSYSSMSLVGTESPDIWDHDYLYGFLVFFEYVGYSEEFGWVYGIYESHELAPPFFDPNDLLK